VLLISVFVGGRSAPPPGLIDVKDHRRLMTPDLNFSASSARLSQASGESGDTASHSFIWRPFGSIALALAKAGLNRSGERTHSGHEVFNGRAEVGTDVLRPGFLEGSDFLEDRIWVARK
jgi:hypothetical protein